jgi:hypothetical protein
VAQDHTRFSACLTASTMVKASLTFRSTVDNIRHRLGGIRTRRANHCAAAPASGRAALSLLSYTGVTVPAAGVEPATIAL